MRSTVSGAERVIDVSTEHVDWTAALSLSGPSAMRNMAERDGGRLSGDRDRCTRIILMQHGAVVAVCSLAVAGGAFSHKITD